MNMKKNRKKTIESRVLVNKLSFPFFRLCQVYCHVEPVFLKNLFIYHL